MPCPPHPSPLSHLRAHAKPQRASASSKPAPTSPQARGVRLPDAPGRVPTARRAESHRGHLEGVVCASVVQVMAHAGNKQGEDLDVPGWETEGRGSSAPPTCPEQEWLHEMSRSHRTGARDTWVPLLKSSPGLEFDRLTAPGARDREQVPPRKWGYATFLMTLSGGSQEAVHVECLPHWRASLARRRGL